MTVTEAATFARVKTLIDRVKSENPGITQDNAFREAARRGWIVRVGVNGPEAECSSVLGGLAVGWKLTDRGNVVAEQTLAAVERAAA